MGVAAASAFTLLVAYLVTGSLLGMAFRTLPWGPAIVVALLGLLPAVLTEGLWTAAIGSDLPITGPTPDGLFTGLFDTGILPGAAAVTSCLLSVALALPVLRRLARYLTFPG